MFIEPTCIDLYVFWWTRWLWHWHWHCMELLIELSLLYLKLLMSTCWPEIIKLCHRNVVISHPDNLLIVVVWTVMQPFHNLWIDNVWCLKKVIIQNCCFKGKYESSAGELLYLYCNQSGFCEIKPLVIYGMFRISTSCILWIPIHLSLIMFHHA